jgi:hypothetical protein
MSRACSNCHGIVSKYEVNAWRERGIKETEKVGKSN